jgi:hypothetical protein
MLFLGLLLLLPFTAMAQQGIEASCTTPNDSACIDWNKGIAYAVGTGAPPAGSGAGANPMARRAARLDAARNLLELIQGINVDSNSTVKNMMVESDVVNITVSGVLKSIREVGQPKYFSDRTIQVKIAASLREVLPQEAIFGSSSGAPRLLEAPGSMPSGGTSLNAQQVYSGLVIDARGTGVLPAMSPKIFDPDGREVYGSAYVSREWAISQGVVGYVKSVDAAVGTDRVKGSPAVVKAVEAKGANKADLVVSKADADMLRAVSQKQTFLSEGRVMIVLD